MTQEQEQYLVDFANKGLAEIAEKQAREVSNTKELEFVIAKNAKLAELKFKHDAETETAIAELEAEIKG